MTVDNTSWDATAQMTSREEKVSSFSAIDVLVFSLPTCRDMKKSRHDSSSSFWIIIYIIRAYILISTLRRYCTSQNQPHEEKCITFLSIYSLASSSNETLSDTTQTWLAQTSYSLLEPLDFRGACWMLPIRH